MVLVDDVKCNAQTYAQRERMCHYFKSYATSGFHNVTPPPALQRPRRN